MREGDQNPLLGLARLIFWLTSSLWASASPAQTLSSALEQAWVRHPQAVAFASREAEAQARVDLAAGLMPAAPRLSLSNTNDRLNAASGKDSWELEWAAPVWLPGQRTAQQNLATQTQTGLTAQRAALRLALAAEVREAWWGIAAARDALGLAKQREASAQQLLADVQRRLKAGELARMEVNLANIEHLNAQAEALEAHNALEQALLVYRNLTGAEPPEAFPEEALAEPTPSSDLHPQGLVARRLVEGAQARLALAQASDRDAPELALRWARERSELGANYADSVGIKLTLPLGSAPRTRAETSAALADMAQAEAEAAQTQHKLEAEIARARRTLSNVQAQLERAEQSRALAQDTLHLSEKSYALGELDLAGLLRARTLAREAKALCVKQRTARAASISRLHQSLGVLP